MTVCAGSLLLVGRDVERMNGLARSLTKAGYKVATSANGRRNGGEAFDLVVCHVRAADSVVDMIGLLAGTEDLLGLIDGADPVTGVGSFGCGAASCIPFPAEEEALLSAVRAAVQCARERRANDADRGRLRRLMDQAPIGVFEIEGERVTYVNEYVVKMSKYSADELLGMNLRDLVAPQDVRRGLDRLSERVRGRTASDPSVYHLIARDGEERTVEIVSKRVEASAGGRVEGAVRDVTAEVRLARLHRAVLELGEAILGEQDVDRILQRVLDTIAEYSGFCRAVLTLYDITVREPLDGDVITMLCSGLSPGDRKALFEQAPLSPRARRQAFSDEFRLGPAFYIPHDRVPWKENVGVTGTRSMDGWHVDDFLFIPLRGTAGIIGCLSVDDPLDLSVPTLASIEPIAYLASFAALAVERVYKLNLLHAQNERLHGLSRFGDQIARVQSTTELCDVATRRVCDEMGYDHCAVWLRDGDALVVESVTTGKSVSRDEMTARGTRSPIEGEGLAPWAARYVEPVVADDVSSDPRYRGSRASIRSAAAVPILGRKGVLGVLDVESKRLEAFGSDDLAVLSSLVSHLSIALAALARREAVTRIYALGQRIAASTSADHIVAGALDFLAEQFNYPLACVFLHGRDGRLSVAGLRGPYPERGVGTGWTLPAEKGIVSWVARNRRFALANDVTSDPRYFEVLPGMRSEIAVPLLFADQLVGVLNVESPEPSFFDDEDRVLLEVVANHLATALANLSSQQSLREQALHDSLTGLFNRRYFNSIIAPELSRSDRYARPFTLMMMDVDNFRAVNNRFGHLKGDEVLREVSRLLLDQVRASDRVIRYGGDEFLIFMPETEESEAALVASRLREQMAYLPRRAGVEEIPLGLSIGIYTRRPRERWSLEAILEEADRRMYEDRRARHVEQANDYRR
jgi:diguanylate cyclase (GGDEF)-like protein/PAS domain S-box-containing protein